MARVKNKISKRKNLVSIGLVLAIVIVFQFLFCPVSYSEETDNTPPEITISAPKESSLSNRRRILVIGKVDGTGSKVKSVLINNENAVLSPAEQTSSNSNVVNFIGDIESENDGQLEIKVVAFDEAGNKQEKSINVNIDTVIPALQVDVNPFGSDFKVSGTTGGTGSKIVSITVNSKPVQFTQNEQVTFSTTTSQIPVTIIAIDSAGNKNELTVANPSSPDKTPPQILITSPDNGEAFKEDPEIDVSFTVTDETGINEVFLNNNKLSIESDNLYVEGLVLKPGENLISILAIDTNGNKSTVNISVSFITSEIKKPVSIANGEIKKEILTLPPIIENLNNELINQLTGRSEKIDFTSTTSFEISNPPSIPEGESANIELPKVEGLEEKLGVEGPQEVPKGFSFASNITFENDETTKITSEEQNNENAVVLVDGAGRTFVVGFAFFGDNQNNLPARKFRFQTTEGNPLELISTFTVPGDATEGNATVSILSGNKSLATILLKVASSKEVKVGKRVIAKPQINDPINAIVKNSAKELKLKVKGKNFLGRIAVIDGKLQKLIGKTRFTNVTFVPSSGLKLKKLKLVNSKTILLTVEIRDNIEPGIKLFNVITPKGADIGAIIFPDPLADGKLTTTSNPESLILEGD